MKWNRNSILLVMVFVSMALIGCVHVRTYTVDKQRCDQDLPKGGNIGYPVDNSATYKEKDQEGRPTRKNYVVEIEMGSKQNDKAKQASAGEATTVEAVQEPANQPVAEQPVQEQAAAPKIAAVSTYTVTNNDTLEKISQKVYGTTTKWKKIYDANSDKLKSPNRIYAGQVLKIPQE